MKILLTGGSGMVGSNILEHQEASNHSIHSPSSKELDLLDKNKILSYLDKVKPEMIIHAAGHVGGIQANMKNPKKFLLDNICMGINLITSSDEIGIKSIINLSSSCMYPREGENPLKENLILTGELEPTNEGYAIAKIMITRLCEYITKEERNRSYKTVIPCNLYGRYDDFHEKKSHMIPAVIKKIDEAKASGKEVIEIWGDGTARREFMSASDLADFIFFAVKNFKEMPQNINVGIGHDFSIKEYYQAISSVVGFSGDFEYDLSKPIGMKQKLVDISRLDEFGWKNKMTLEDGLKEAYEYFKQEF